MDQRKQSLIWKSKGKVFFSGFPLVIGNLCVGVTVTENHNIWMPVAENTIAFSLECIFRYCPSISVALGFLKSHHNILFDF